MPPRRSLKAFHNGESQMTLTQLVRAMPPKRGGRASLDARSTSGAGSSRATPIDLRSPSPPNSVTEPVSDNDNDSMTPSRQSKRQQVDSVPDDTETDDAESSIKPSRMGSPSSTLRTRDACTCTRLGPCALHTTISPIIRHPFANPKEAEWIEPPNDVVHPKECDGDSVINNRGFPPPVDNEESQRSRVQLDDSNDVVDSSQTQMLSFQEDYYPARETPVNINSQNDRTAQASSHVPQAFPASSTNPGSHSLTPALHSSFILSSQTPEYLYIPNQMDTTSNQAPAACLPHGNTPHHSSSRVNDAAACLVPAIPYNLSAQIVAAVGTTMDSPLHEYSPDATCKDSESEPQEPTYNEHIDSLDSPMYDAPESQSSNRNSIHSARAASSPRAAKVEYRLASQSLYEETIRRSHDVASSYDRSSALVSEMPPSNVVNTMTSATTNQHSKPQTRRFSYKTSSASSYSSAVSGENTPPHIKRMLSGSYDASLQRYIDWEGLGPNNV